MGYKDDDDDLPEAPPIQMVVETFSEVISEPNKDNKDNNKE